MTMPTDELAAIIDDDRLEPLGSKAMSDKPDLLDEVKHAD